MAASSKASPASHQRLTFTLANMIGMRVQVQMMSGAVYEGILHGSGVGKESSLGVVLLMAYKRGNTDAKNPFVGPQAGASRDTYIEKLLIKDEDIGQIFASGVDLSSRAPPPDGFDAFTDTGISRGHGPVVERELQAWTPAPDDVLDAGGLGNGGRGGRGGAWDANTMIQQHERNYNYKSDFHENLYTTELNTSSPEYANRMRNAERITAEIMSGVATDAELDKNPHVIADRGLDVDVGEEDMFSAVNPKNGSTNSSGRYVPPALRKKGERSPAKRVGTPESTQAASPAGTVPPSAVSGPSDESKPESTSAAKSEPKTKRGGSEREMKKTINGLKTFKGEFVLDTSSGDKDAVEKKDDGEAEKQTQEAANTETAAKKTFKLRASAAEFSMPAPVSTPAAAATPLPASTAAPLFVHGVSPQQVVMQQQTIPVFHPNQQHMLHPHALPPGSPGGGMPITHHAVPMMGGMHPHGDFLRMPPTSQHHYLPVQQGMRFMPHQVVHQNQMVMVHGQHPGMLMQPRGPPQPMHMHLPHQENFVQVPQFRGAPRQPMVMQPHPQQPHPQQPPPQQ